METAFQENIAAYPTYFLSQEECNATQHEIH